MNSILENTDWWALGIYFSILLIITLWFGFRRKKNLSEYFLAGRSVGWFVIGSSIFATNVSGSHMIGLTGVGAESGMPMAHFELHSIIVLLLGWVFLPFYYRSKVFTMPKFIEKRFDGRSRWILSAFSVFWYVLVKVSTTIYAGGVVVSELMGIPFWYGATGIVLITGLYTAIGGLKIVMYTESVQAIIIILSAVIMTYLGLQEVGGWDTLKTTVGSEYFNMWRPISDPDFPWAAMLFGGIIMGIWYWCTEMYIVQKALTANNIKIARRGTIFAAYLKLLPMFIFILPGIIGFALAKQGVLIYDSPDHVFPALMKALLPVGIKGLVTAGLLAALMSSLASVFISCSSIFTIDIYPKIVPFSKELDLVKAGKWVTVTIAFIGIIWISYIEMTGTGVIYGYILNFQAYFAPSITAIFLLGIFWKRINSTAAMSTLIAGLILGVLRIIAEVFEDSLTGVLHVFASLHFGYMAIFLFVISIIICIGVSLFTEHPNYLTISGLTFGTLSKEDIEQSKKSVTPIDVFLSAILIGIVIFILSYFAN